MIFLFSYIHFCFIFQISHISETTLFVFVWLILPNIITSRSIHVIANCKTAFFFFSWVIFHCVRVYVCVCWGGTPGKQRRGDEEHATRRATVPPFARWVLRDSCKAVVVASSPRLHRWPCVCPGGRGSGAACMWKQQRLPWVGGFGAGTLGGAPGDPG